MATSKRPTGRGSASAALRPPGRAAASQPAFVLHRWDWSETSLILDLFTRESGRIAAVAKGAKRPYSQLRPVLVQFQRLQCSLGRASEAEGSGEIVTLRSADYAGGGSVLPPERLLTGFYLNELLQKLLPRGDAHPVLFDAYADALLALAEDSGEAPMRAFELVLLRQLGLLPELDLDTPSQRPVHPDRAYRLDAEAGLVALPADEADAPGSPGRLSGRITCLLEAALAAHRWAELRATTGLAALALRQQLRPVLHYHLGSPRLRTRQLMLDLRRLAESA